MPDESRRQQVPWYTNRATKVCCTRIAGLLVSTTRPSPGYAPDVIALPGLPKTPRAALEWGSRSRFPTDLRPSVCMSRFPGVLASSVLCSIALLSGCAGSTLGSGVSDEQLEHPPWYAGDRVSRSARIAHLPISYQRGAEGAAIFEPAGHAGTPIAVLLGEMNRYLDSLGATTALRPASPLRGIAPNVTFGCVTDPSGDCAPDPLGAPVDPSRRILTLAVGRPSDSWVESMRPLMQSAGAEKTLLITLEIGQYWTRQRNLRGSKEVELGTRYSVDVPWLTSLETPVTVLQLTGALINPDGKATRIGAEGLYPRRTRLLVSAIGGQELLSDEDVERVRAQRRDDLPGRPLVWQVALRNLVAQLTGRSEVALR